jgi:ABC-type spermidine/putrescine transport system permease subunit II
VRRSGSRLLSASGWAVVAFLYVPVLVLAAYSFNAGERTVRWEGASTVWYARLFDGSHRDAVAARGPLLLSLRLGAAAAGVAVVLSAATALGLRRAGRAATAVLLGLWSLPIVLPDVVLGVSFSRVFQAAGLESGFLPLLLAHATIAAAFALVVVRARLATLDPTLLDAARDLGATRAQALRHEVVPHLAPALLAAALLAFTISFDDFMVTYFLHRPIEPTLPVWVQGKVVKGPTTILNVLATLSLAATFLLAFVALRAVRAGTSRRLDG